MPKLSLFQNQTSNVSITLQLQQIVLLEEFKKYEKIHTKIDTLMTHYFEKHSFDFFNNVKQDAGKVKLFLDRMSWRVSDFKKELAKPVTDRLR